MKYDRENVVPSWAGDEGFGVFWVDGGGRMRRPSQGGC